MFDVPTLRVGALLMFVLLSGGRAQTPRFGELRRMIPSVLDRTSAVAFGDVDGDGDLDALVGNTFDQDRLLLNDGSGVFSDATVQLPAILGRTNAIALGDVDGDGDLDALIANGFVPQEQNRLYVNDGSGVFTDATNQLPSMLDGSLAVALGDVDGDGDLDALIGNSASSFPWTQDRLYLHDGSGVFTYATNQLPAILDTTFAVALGDVDGDGDLDAYIGNAGSFPQDRLYLNNGSGVFGDGSVQVPALADNTTDVELGDVDADGDLDVWIGNGGQDRLLLNDGSGFFSDATAQVPVDSDNTRAVVLGDVDEDGDLDALVGNGFVPGEQNGLYLNNGSGVFTDATSQLPTIADPTTALALGDVDGDGDLDVMVGNSSASLPGVQERLHLNDGSGHFTDVTVRLPASLDRTSALALGDVDGDGDLDALIGNAGFSFSGELDRLLVNDGSGVLSDATTQLPAIPDRTASLALGDVDGDGDLDALIGNGVLPFFGEQNRLLLNDGSGVFTDATAQVPAVLGTTLAVALGDLDGDGDLDAFIGNGGNLSGVQDRLLLNDGSGAKCQYLSATRGPVPPGHLVLPRIPEPSHSEETRMPKKSEPRNGVGPWSQRFAEVSRNGRWRSPSA